MNCYICDKGASARCFDCERWICTDHTIISGCPTCKPCHEKEEAYYKYLGSPEYEAEQEKIYKKERALERKQKEEQERFDKFMNGCCQFVIAIIIIAIVVAIVVHLKNK